MKLLETEWAKFCFMCFKDLTPEQYADHRRTFYGGAAAFFGIASDSEADPFEIIFKLRDEIQQFKDDVKAGRA
jgi:hypothetical protein